MARQVTIYFEDGHEETVGLRPKNMIAAERLLNKPAESHAVELTFLAAWKASRSPLKFDDWLDTVDRLEEQGEVTTEEGVDPTEPVPSPAESQS